MPPPELLPLHDAAVIGELLEECLKPVKFDTTERWDVWRQLWEHTAAGGHVDTLHLLKERQPQLEERIADWERCFVQHLMRRASATDEARAWRVARVGAVAPAAVVGAARAGRADVLTWLLEQYPPADVLQEGLWEAAASGGGSLAVLLLLAESGCPGEFGSSLLGTAMAAGCALEAVEWAVRQRGCSVAEGAMVAAAIRGDAVLLQRLQAMGGPLTAGVASALARHGRTELLEWAGGQGCVFAEAQLCEAVSAGRAEVVEWILLRAQQTGRELTYKVDGLDSYGYVSGIWRSPVQQGDLGTLATLLQYRGGNTALGAAGYGLRDAAYHTYSLPFVFYALRHGEPQRNHDTGERWDFCSEVQVVLSADEESDSRRGPRTRGPKARDAAPEFGRWAREACALMEQGYALAKMLRSAAAMDEQQDEMGLAVGRSHLLCALAEMRAAYNKVAEEVDARLASVMEWDPAAA